MEKKTIYCANCGEAILADVFHDIHSDQNGHMTRQIMSGALFEVECPSCHYVTHMQYDTIYHNAQHSAKIQLLRPEDPAYAQTIKMLRQEPQEPCSTLRLVNDIPSFKEKVSCLAYGRDDRIVELCKAYLINHLRTQYPSFQSDRAYYYIECEKERIQFCNGTKNILSCQMPEDLYEELKKLYFSSPYAAAFDGNYPIVDLKWAEPIVMSFDVKKRKDISQLVTDAQMQSDFNLSVERRKAAVAAADKKRKIRRIILACIAVVIIAAVIVWAEIDRKNDSKLRNFSTEKMDDDYTNVYADIVTLEPQFYTYAKNGYYYSLLEEPKDIICQCTTIEGKVIWVSIPKEDYPGDDYAPYRFSQNSPVRLKGSVATADDVSDDFKKKIGDFLVLEVESIDYHAHDK